MNLFLDCVNGLKIKRPPVWFMRQAGRYLSDYRRTRARAGSFLNLCYNSDLATEVTLQPIEKFGFDAAILFADILLLPQALGADLWFVTGEGPRLSTMQTKLDFENLRKPEEINETLAPVYETVKILSEELPRETTLIGFAGAPWTVATYMVAGRGTPDQAPAHLLKNKNPELFDDLINLLIEGTIEYLSHQIIAGAEVVKIFDSWAGSLKGNDFDKYAVEPCKKIISALKVKHPHIPIIAFPRQASNRYIGFSKQVGSDCIALDESVSAEWISQNIQVDGCVQGNLASSHMVSGGNALVDETKRIVKALSNGPHIFNLGHGITPEADPQNVQIMIDTIRTAE